MSAWPGWSATRPPRVRAIAGMAAALVLSGPLTTLMASAAESGSPSACCAVLASDPQAPRGSPYAIDRYTLDGGGGSSTGANYEFSGTIGQPDADPLQPSSGGAYEVTGGFWPGLAPAEPRPDALFANGFE